MDLMLDLTTAQWRKSSYSDFQGQCVEVAALQGARWSKSSYSMPEANQCIEVAAAGGIVAVRDSKDPQGPALAFAPAAFAAFVDAVRHASSDQALAAARAGGGA
jgi:Domain of unknown function (DUF397)